MLFRQRPKNKRFKRAHVLDVKLRSKQARTARVRRLAIFCQMAVVLAVGGFLLWRTAQWGLNRFIYENDFFAVQNLEIQTDGAIGVEQLRQWANIQKHDNLIALDLSRIKRDLEICPWIRSATVERWLPGTVRIRVLERKPLAQVRAFHHRSDGGGFEQMTFQLDEGAVVMVPIQDALSGLPAAQADGLPIITGLPESVLRVGKKAAAPSLEAALKLIQAFKASPMAGESEIRQIDIARPQVLQLITVEGSEIIFALDHFEKQLDRWRAIHDFGVRQGKTILSLDLSVSNHLPATWLENGPSQPPSPKPGKTDPAAKKYV